MLYQDLINRLLLDDLPIDPKAVFGCRATQHLTPFERGHCIEQSFLYYIYQMNHKVIVPHLEIEPLSQGGYDVHTKNVYRNFIDRIRTDKTMALIASARFLKFTLRENEVEDVKVWKTVERHFVKAKKFFKADYRCMIKARFINTYPDVVVDDLIVDIKTDCNLKDHRKNLQQVFRQYLKHRLFLAEPLVRYRKDVGEMDKQLLRLPINRIGIYYWRFNLLLTVNVASIGTESEFDTACDELKAHQGLVLVGRVKPEEL